MGSTGDIKNRLMNSSLAPGESEKRNISDIHLLPFWFLLYDGIVTSGQSVFRSSWISTIPFGLMLDSRLSITPFL